MCVCHAAPGGDLCPAAGRDGNVVWRRPDSLYAHGYIAARSFHGLHAQQPQLLFRGLMFIHRALVGRPMPLPVLPVLLTYIQYIYTQASLIKEVHEEKERRNAKQRRKLFVSLKLRVILFFLHCILAYLLTTIYIIYLLLL